MTSRLALRAFAGDFGDGWLSLLAASRHQNLVDPHPGPIWGVR